MARAALTAATVVAMSAPVAPPTFEHYMDAHGAEIGLAPGSPVLKHAIWEIDTRAREEWRALHRRYERRLERERQARLAERQAELVEPVIEPEVTASVDWYAIAECESSGDWTTNTGNSYYGGLQILLDTWNGYGGQEFAAYPHLASPEAQIVVAERILAGQGIDAWPTCGIYG